MKENKKREVIKYTIAGILFGCLFPYLSTTIEIIEHGLPFTAASFIQEQASNPLLWIIDTAIPILGYFGYQVGIRQKKLSDQAEQLEEMVSERSDEILRQKLFYEALVENSPLAVVTLDENHRVNSINPAFETIFGYSTNDVKGKHLDDLIAGQAEKEEAQGITRQVQGGKTIQAEGRRKRKDGSFVDTEIIGKPIKIGGQRIGVLGMYRDITFEKSAREKLEASEERFRRMFLDSPVALRMEDLSEMRTWIQEKQDQSGQGIDVYLREHPDQFDEMIQLMRITSLNSATLQLFGAKSLDDLQDNYDRILNSESREEKLEIVSCLLGGETSIERELIYNDLEGNPLHVITRLSILPGSEETWDSVLFSNVDITERKIAEERLEYISLHDPLTRLYNRSFFNEEISRMTRGRIRPISILVGDLDNLKQINDKFGHQAGDRILQHIADILRECLRSDDIIARIGGDEFAILLPGIDAGQAVQVRDRIDKHISQHNQVNKRAERISLSVGCATAYLEESLEEMLKLADQDMYREKQEKKNGD